jgi:hypothetical protein
MYFLKKTSADGRLSENERLIPENEWLIPDNERLIPENE